MYSGGIRVVFGQYPAPFTRIQLVFGLYSGCIAHLTRIGLYSSCIRVVFGLYSGCIRVVFGLYSDCIRVVFGCIWLYLVVFDSYASGQFNFELPSDSYRVGVLETSIVFELASTAFLSHNS